MSRPRNVAAASLALVAILVACNEGSPPPAAPITLPANAEAGADAASLTTGAIDASTVLAAAIGDSGVDAASIDTRPDASKDAASDASDAQSRDFYSCAADIDCIAVPKVGCCSNGYKEAVNKESATAYAQSFTCPTPNQMCPHYILNDTRVPECNGGTHKCEMVAIDQIKCGGLGPSPHVCPSDHRCVTPKTPSDATGHCRK